MSEFRIERDTMGEVPVPSNAYFGAQTQRAVENFPVSGWQIPPALIHALGLVKRACCVANRDLGKLSPPGAKQALTAAQVDALLAAAREVAEGKFDDQFPIDVFQSGSGTSTNMNCNEVIANREKTARPAQPLPRTSALLQRLRATDATMHPRDHRRHD